MALHEVVTDVRSSLSGLQAELAAVRLELASLKERLPVPAAEAERIAGARQRAAALQGQLQQGLSQGIDPAEDAALDLLIDQLHDLAAEL
ncbi:MAG: hypothetical protein ACKOCM_02505 [Cyanobacteriota bacterium]